MKSDPQSLMLFTLVKNLKKLGYVFKVIFSVCVDRQSVVSSFCIPL